MSDAMYHANRADRFESERDAARAELVRVHTSVWAATNDARIMGYDGESTIRMVRAALVDTAAPCWGLNVTQPPPHTNQRTHTT